MSGDTAVQRRLDPEGHDEGLNRLLERQVSASRRRGGELDLNALLRAVSSQYDRIEEERRGIVRSMQLMSDEAQALTREIREQSASHLQAILDNVKDAIITVGEDGHIETCNPTSERIFGYGQAEMTGRTLEFLLPDLVDRGGARAFLDRLAARVEDTHIDLAAHQVWGRSNTGERFAAEIAVSKARLNRRDGYIVCIRDTTERHLAEQQMRESEARYRTLVENAPEAIVVFDVDQHRFVDVNENACRFFRMDRSALLEAGPDRVSPPHQPDGTPSFGVVRGHIQNALDGGTPVFEWMHCDSAGKSLPCEVRLVRLPSSSRRLVRGSITYIAERKRAETIAIGERRILERVAANAPLPATLQTIAEVIESVMDGAACSIQILDPGANCLTFGAAPSLPREFVAAMDACPVGVRYGSCGAAVYLARAVIVADIEADALWEYRRDAADRANLRSSWSVPIHASDATVIGTIAVFRQETGTPTQRDLDLTARMSQLAGITIERRRAEDALRESESRYRGLFQSVMEGVFQTTLEGRFIAVNRAFIEIFGYASAAEISAVNVSELYANPGERENFIRRVDAEDEVRNEEFNLRRKDGSIVTVLESARAVRDMQGRCIGFEGTMVDITERKKAETAVFQEKERAQVTLQSIGDAVITTDSDGLIDYMNPVAESLTGWENRAAQRRSIDDVLVMVQESTHEPIENPISRCLREGQVQGLTEAEVLINLRGQEIAIQTSAAPIRDRAGHLIGAVIVFHDVSRERRLHRALHYQASHDALTGLINRREFEHRLNAAVEHVRQDARSQHALLYLDLDQFKIVNDTCGHPAGDQLLRQITGVLQSRVRAGDTLARLGGDEFGILLEQCSLDQAMRIADSLRQAIRDFRFRWQDRVLTVGVSIGIVEITPATATVASVMSAADVACYEAKDQGRDRIQLYKPDDLPERHREMHWVSRLTRACDESSFDLFFQPIVSISGQEDPRQHFELMLRLQDDDGTLVTPVEFIPAAERYNIMPAIDRWVVRYTLEHVAHLQDSGASPFTVAVNLSGTSLNDERFLEFLINELGQRRLSPGAVCFEITETAAISNLGNVVYFMRELKSRGCRFALDDFGSGLSSFMYLKTLPVDYLKIDGQFIENVTHDPVDRSMVEAISQVGRAMGIQTIAERVETREILHELGRLGISYAQGFFIAAPRPIAQFPFFRDRDASLDQVLADP